MFDQYRWYYNAILQVTMDHHCNNGSFDKSKFRFSYLRDLLKKHKYIEEEGNGLVFQEFVFDKDRNKNPLPEWWSKEVHNRVTRGAVAKFTSSLNSALSNLKNKNIKHFQMNFMKKKSPFEMLHFEDNSFPSWIRKIKSRYWFTSKSGKKTCMSYSDIGSKKGLEVIHEKETDKYFLHVPIERSWFPEEDRRSENQAKFTSEKTRVISLDPGIRKFLVGYDPEGKCYFIGEGAYKKLTSILHEIDRRESLNSDGIIYSPTYFLWKKIKNMVSDLHWKAASFLVENYDIILLPEFRTSQMVKKGGKLSKSTRRLMNMFSFYKFKEKLTYKCETYGKKLLIVDESYTSCTCGVCGCFNKTDGETYECKRGCGIIIDRDIAGSRNILIKNSVLTLRTDSIKSN